MDPARDMTVARIVEALLEGTLADRSIDELLDQLGRRIVEAGIPVWRFAVVCPTLHPLEFGTNRVWSRERGLFFIERSQTAMPDRADWRNSPYAYVVRTGKRHHRVRIAEGAPVDFPLLAELRENGGTDYVCFRIPLPIAMTRGPMYGAADGILGSWTTDDPDGWSDEHLAALRQIETAMVIAVRMAAEREIARNIVTTYLGTEAGSQVLAGTIQRGDCRRIRAVIWFSDLRGSTPLAERLLPEEFMRILNAYFECTVQPVVESGGEVLRFIGDAALAVFPVESQADVADACRRALAAAREADTRVRALNEQRAADGDETLGYGIALHEGEVSFGNIGIPTRLEFSVIGPAANEAARVESLTKSLGEPTLVTQAFARHLAIPWRSVGRHALRGVSGEAELFAPPKNPDA